MKKLIAIALLLTTLLCGCTVETPNYQNMNTSTTSQTQNEPDKKSGYYAGVLTEEFGFGVYTTYDFERTYGSLDTIKVGERITTATIGEDKFQFNKKGLSYAGISSERFEGVAGIRCSMTLKEASDLLLPEYAENIDYQSEEFQSIYGRSSYDEYMGMELVIPYCVFYKLNVEDATPDSTYVMMISEKSDYGTEEVTIYFSEDKIITSFSMQLINT